MNNAKEFLSGFYKEEKIHTQHAEFVAPLTLSVTCAFPEYDRTRSELGHVGVSQITEALVEGMYLVIAGSIEKGDLLSSIDLETYKKRMKDALFVRQEISYRKLLQPKEEAEFTLKILSTKEQLRNKYFAVTVEVSGFMRGEVECWLPKEEA